MMEASGVGWTGISNVIRDTGSWLWQAQWGREGFVPDVDYRTWW